MKLVGATNWYVRAPYVLQSLIFAFISVFISSLILVPLILVYYNDLMSSISGGLDISNISVNIVVFWCF